MTIRKYLRTNITTRILTTTLLLSGVGAITQGCESAPTTQTAQGCTKDSDCKRERICNYNTERCETTQYQDATVKNPCGDSPFYAKYTWNTNCPQILFSMFFDKDCSLKLMSGNVIGKNLGKYKGLSYERTDGQKGSFKRLKRGTYQDIEEDGTEADSYALKDKTYDWRLCIKQDFYKGN